MAQVTKSSHPTSHYSKGGCVKKFNEGGEVGTPLINPDYELKQTGSQTYPSAPAAAPSLFSRARSALTTPIAPQAPEVAQAPAAQGSPNRIGSADKGLAPEATNPTRGMSPAQAAAYFKNKGK